ncbi:Aromatic ring-opening dioxygenase, catalytic subunit, LigB family [Modicisalibacter muralis]|uniref:Aromatic ring-opening dioxygenase, catalytic subunit, LigB family n=1 Tax=Modicisalibacter muralis TaxID=119000 RepID=A0A1G9PV45_9GAMM|nr:class III extradiol ring-cleavage dioxygenase [Halomonas muralis]SDM02624.1 Aromatic ring-opening dioxygenase, catalytic subunit, LigB family [Halomonas muralis]
MRNVLFISHGSPSLTISEHPARDFLVELGQRLPRPRGALVVSAHFETPTLTLGGAAQPQTLHDFHGFPQVMYQQRYPAPGLPDIAERLSAQLSAHGIEARVDSKRPLDHGIWSPLSLVWPEADVPLLPVSVPMALGDNERLALAAQLGRFAEREELWLIGSGSATHNLGDRKPGDARPDAWAQAFHDWSRDVAERGDLAALGDWQRRAPHARHAHPTPEHFLPLLMAVGALEGAPMTTLHESFMFGNLSMLCLAASATADTLAA